MKQQTAMQELLDTLKEEKSNLPVDMLQWSHCLQSIITVIEKHYIDKEEKQMIEFTEQWSAQYYNTSGKKDYTPRGIIPFFKQIYKK